MCIDLITRLLPGLEGACPPQKADPNPSDEGACLRVVPRPCMWAAPQSSSSAAGGYGTMTMASSPVHMSPSMAWSSEEGMGGSPSSVLIFGLSANPPTGRHGHAGIVQYLASLGKWEEIWVTPVYKHMHAKNSTLIDFEHRYNMCRLNFTNEKQGSNGRKQQPQSRIRVVRLEKEVVDFHIELARQAGQGTEDVKVGTIDVVLYAQEMKPTTAFSLTLGTDTYADLKNGKWKRGAELQKLVSLVVVARPGVTYSCTDEEASDPRVSFHNVPNLSDISSTAVRLTSDLKYLRKALEPQVLNYIRTHRLYSFGDAVGRPLYYLKHGLRFGVVASIVVVGIFLVWHYFKADATPQSIERGQVSVNSQRP